MIERKYVATHLIAVCVGVMIGVSFLVLSRQTRPAPIVINPPEPTPTPPPTATPGPIRVFVNGQVAQPDVYEVPPDSLVQTAVAAAGGFTDAANTAVVNLAQPLSDGMQVYVPSLEEAVQPAAVVSEPAPVRSATLDLGTDASDLVNINSADLETLDTLPGIGPSTAQNILDYRDANGLFDTIEAIMNVSGIGDAKFEQIESLITVGE